MSYEDEERLDLERVKEWLGVRGIEARLLPSKSGRKTPDFELWRDERSIGFCEVKSLGLGPWDWRSTTLTDGGLLAFQGNYVGVVDKTKARIANVITGAVSQLTAASDDCDAIRIIAIMNRGWDADHLDLQAVLAGEEIRDGLPPYREADNPNKQIATAKLNADAVIWLELEGLERLFVNEIDPEKAERTRKLLSAS